MFKRQVIILMVSTLVITTFVSAQHRVGINVLTPQHPLHIIESPGEVLGDFEPIIYGNYTGNNSNNVVGVMGVSRPVNGYGIGGYFDGGNTGAWVRGHVIGGSFIGNSIGISAQAQATGTEVYHGILTSAVGGNGTNYGIYSTAYGAAITNYGVYGRAYDGQINYAGYFSDGMVGIENYLGIGNTLPAFPLHVQQPISAQLLPYEPVIFGEYTGSNTLVIGIKGSSIEPGGGGIGGSFEGGYIGVAGKVTDTGYNWCYGVIGEVEGDAGINYGVLGSVTGDGTNFGVLGTVSGAGTNYAIYGDASGNGINYAVFAAGDIAYTGDLLQVSDQRLKHMIHPMAGSLKALMELKPRTYRYKVETNPNMNLSSGIHFGFIAQEIMDVFPNLVHDVVFHTSSSNDANNSSHVDRMLAVNYIEFIPILTAAIQEQQEQIEELKRMVYHLSQREE